MVGFSGQLLAISAAVLVPLIYTDKLPRFNFVDLHITPPISRPAPPPENLMRQQSTSTATAGPKVFTAPSRIPDRAANIVDDKSQTLTVDNNAPFVRGMESFQQGDSAMSFVVQNIATPLPPPPPVVGRDPAVEKKVDRIKLGGQVQEAKILRRIIPIYPQIAIQARVSGKVQLLGVISREGAVQQLQVISGHPLLTKAAVDAVMQWTYRPTLLNGEPVEVVAPIEVNFTLNR